MTTEVTPDRTAPSPEPQPGAGRGAGRRRVLRFFWTRGANRTGRPGRPRPPRSPGRRRLRRRLLLASAPVVLAALLLAAKLVSLNLVHGQTLEAYRAGHEVAAQDWAGRQGWVNVVEPFRAAFAMGDAYLLVPRYDEARPWFEKALEQVPKGGLDECKVRVNLGLTYERLGDEAKARERTLEWQQFYAKGLETTRQRPPLCDVPERGGQTGEQLQQAQERMEGKSQNQEPGQSDQPTPAPQDTPQPQPQPTPAPTLTPDPEQVPSEPLQRQLEQLQKRNTMERNRQLGNGTVPPGAGGQTYPKPW